MATQPFVGGSTPDVTISWTAYGYVESTSAANGVQLPTSARTAFNGNKPVYVTNVRTYMAGRGGTRSMRVYIGGQVTNTKNVASASSASGYVDFTLNKAFSNGGNQTVKYDEVGTTDGFYFGRASSGGGCTDGNTANFGGSLSGSVTYFEVPNAPTLNTATQDGISQDVNLSWTAPTDNGGTAITGYIVDYSTTSGFTSYTSISTGSTGTTYKVTGLTYGQTYYFRIRALNATATAASTSSVASSSLSVTLTIPGTDGWENFGTLPANNTALIERAVVPGITTVGLHRKITATATGGSYTSGNFGMRRTITGLTAGVSYTVSGTAKLGTSGILGNIYRFAVTGIGNGSSLTLSGTTAGTVPSYTFTATGTSHVLEFELAESYTVTGTPTITVEDVYLYNLTVTRVATDLTLTKGYWIQDNLFSGSLADHYDLTMRSIGGYWWVDKKNETQFAQDLSYTQNIGTFTDGYEYVSGVLTPGQSTAGELHYLTVDAGYDTTQVINDLVIINEGLTTPAGDTSPTAWQASWQQENATSKTNWGTRRTELQTNLWLDSVDNLLPNPSCEVNTDGISNGATTIAVKKLRQITKGASGVTSTTSNTISLGSKTFAYTTSSFYTGSVGKRLRVWNTANSRNFVEGVITAVTTTSITVSVDTIGGSGTFTAWTLSIVTPITGENRCLMMKSTSGTSTAAIDPYWFSQDGEEILVEPGKAYMAIAYAARAGNPTDLQTSLAIRWYDDAGTFLSQSSTAATTLTTQGQWYKFVTAGIAPVDANNAVLRTPFVRSGGGSWNVGNAMYVDAVTLIPAVTINTQTPTGTTNITMTTAEPHGIAVGETVVLAGFTPAGYNGTWTAQTGTTGSTLVLNIGSNPGAITVGSGASTVTDFFDGNTVDTSTYIYDWLGDKDESVSRRSENRLYTRASDILTAFANPQVIVKSFTWNAAENPIVAGTIDIGKLLTLKFNGTSATYRVAGLEHEITPNEWYITVQVQKV